MAKPVVRGKASSTPTVWFPDRGPRADVEKAPVGSPANPLAPPVPHRGASTGRRLAGFRPMGHGPVSVVNLSGPELVRRSRDVRRNNPHGKRALDLYATHVVGTGIRPRWLCENAKVRQALTKLWDDWTRVADADGVLDFYGLQALAMSETAEGGEIFGRLRARRIEDGLPVPLQIQLLPTEQVPLSKNEFIGLNRITQGIERTPFGKRNAYWMHPFNPADVELADQFQNEPSRVPAEDVVHMFNVTRIGQMRGLPWLAAAISTLHQINDYVDAELLRKQMVAALVGFVKKANADDITPEQVANSFGEAVDGGDKLAVALEPGTMQYLDPGEDVEFTHPADVGGSFDAFVSTNYRAVAASANILYEELTGDWKNANDRTFRAQFNTFKRQARQWCWSMVCAQFNAPIANRFIDYALASGALVLPKGVDEADVRRVSWNPERWEYLQPVQDIQATGEAIALGLTSRTAEVAERGDDVEVVDGQIAADRAREKKLGLAFGPANSKPPGAAQQAETAPKGAKDASS